MLLKHSSVGNVLQVFLVYCLANNYSHTFCLFLIYYTLYLLICCSDVINFISKDLFGTTYASFYKLLNTEIIELKENEHGGPQCNKLRYRKYKKWSY